FPFHLGQAEMGGVVQILPCAQARFAGTAVTNVAEILIRFESGGADAARAVFTRLAVTGLGADTPVAELALAAEHETLYFLCFLPGLELAGDFRLAQFTRQLWVAKRGDQALTYFIILVTAIQAAEPDFAVFVRAVIQVQTQAGALTGDVIAALFDLFQPSTVIKVPGTAGFHVVRTEFALLPAQGSGDTEVIHAVANAEAIAEGAGQLGAVLAGVFIMTAFGAEAVEQAVMVEG